ncbi:MAG: class I SAM-dependent methyltransferase [Myxococcota bacterium]
MGLARGAICLLMEEARRRPFEGSVATLGRQTVLVTGTELAGLFDRFAMIPEAPIDTRGDEVDDEALLKALGFKEVHSFDYSSYEGATHLLDLNVAGPPERFVEQYDVVLDSGTMEHVFHIPNVLRNVFLMTKPGGRVIFLSPSSNHLDHGFYMFSPTFFYDYYTANGFQLETIFVVRYSPDPEESWDIYEYSPGEWRGLSLGGLDAQPYAIFFVATKTRDATWDVVPQQGYYSNGGAQYQGSDIQTEEAVAQPSGQRFHGLRAVLKNVPGARPLVRVARSLLRRKPGTPEASARKHLGMRLHARY